MNQVDAGKVGKLQAAALVIVASGFALAAVIVSVAELLKAL